MITPKITELIKRNEGLRLKPYKCTTGKTTIGYGRNLDDVGITEREAEGMLFNDLARAEMDARSLFVNFDDLTEARQAVLIDMAYNLGKSGLMQFRNFRLAILAQDYHKAVEEMIDSDWARQVKGRAIRLSILMEKGVWQ